MRPALVVFALLLLGCDPVVDRRTAGAPYVATRREGCSKFGFCMTCMPGFNGKMECGFKMSAFCPGSHDVTAEYTPTARVHKSGAVDTITTLTRFLREGPCE